MQARKLTRDDVKHFDAKSAALVLDMVNYGWLGRVSKNGHVIMYAPDGETTAGMGPNYDKARAGLNATAKFKAWQRDHPEIASGATEIVGLRSKWAEPVEVFSEESGVPGRPICGVCGKSFASLRSLSGHRRKHALKTKDCPECGRPYKYLDKHRQAVHGVTPRVDALEALMEVLSELDSLRSEVKQYRKLYGPIK